MSDNVTNSRYESAVRAVAAAMIAGAVVLGATGSALAGDWKKGRPYYYGPAPAYVVAPGHYYAPAPVVYAAPPPMVVYPMPVAYAPAYPAYGPPGGSLSLGINLPLR